MKSVRTLPNPAPEPVIEYPRLVRYADTSGVTSRTKQYVFLQLEADAPMIVVYSPPGGTQKVGTKWGVVNSSSIRYEPYEGSVTLSNE